VLPGPNPRTYWLGTTACHPPKNAVVNPPRVAAATVALECELYDRIEVGVSVLILGEVVHAHVDEPVLTDDRIDTDAVESVGRPAGNYYAATQDRFELERQPWLRQFGQGRQLVSCWLR